VLRIASGHAMTAGRQIIGGSWPAVAEPARDCGRILIIA
jgi:hypothetical protein